MNAPHLHDAPTTLSRLPDVDPSIGEAARQGVAQLMTVLTAKCNDCYLDAVRKLDQIQQAAPSRVTIQQRPDDDLLGVTQLRSLDPAADVAPTLAEAVYADLLRCSAALLIQQADELGMEAAAHAAGMLDNLLQGSPEEHRHELGPVFESVARLVDERADAEEALVLAQGVAAVAELMGGDGAKVLVNYMETAARLLVVLAGVDTGGQRP